VQGCDPEEAALLGLVRDVGRVAILAAQDELERASRGQVQLASESLDQIADALHCVVGALLADAWSLVPAVVAAISHHHPPAAAPAEVGTLARVVSGADALARSLVREDRQGEAPAIDGLAAERAAAALEEAREAHAELTKVL
jgi:HD-like signal output (HDOD) protein